MGDVTRSRSICAATPFFLLATRKTDPGQLSCLFRGFTVIALCLASPGHKTRHIIVWSTLLQQAIQMQPIPQGIGPVHVQGLGTALFPSAWATTMLGLTKLCGLILSQLPAKSVWYFFCCCCGWITGRLLDMRYEAR